MAVLGVTTAFVTGAPLEFAAITFFLALATAVAVVDAKELRIPDAIVLPAYPVIAGLLVLATWNRGRSMDWGRVVRAGTGALALAMLFLLLAVTTQAIGGGDIKLAGLLGAYLAWFDWPTLLLGALLGFLIAAVQGVALLLSRRGTLKSNMPLGPALLAGGSIAMLLAAAP